MAPVQKQRNKAYFVKHILDLDLTNVLTTATLTFIIQILTECRSTEKMTINHDFELVNLNFTDHVLTFKVKS